MGHGRVFYASLVYRWRTQGPRHKEAETRRPLHRDPASCRALSPRGCRHVEARRAPDNDRLRRPAGRRRHEVRVDHGWHGRARRRRAQASRCRRYYRESHRPPHRGGVGRRLRRKADAAVSVGVCDGKPTLDLDYAHDSTAEVDLNVVMTDDGRYVELQGTAEHKPFTEESLNALRALARKGLKRIFALTR